MSQDFFITDEIDACKFDIDVIMQDPSWSNIAGLSEIISRATKAAIAYVELNKYAQQIEFAVILTDDDSMAKLNTQYRGKNQPTNTLSFPTQEINHKELAKIKLHDGFVLLGDIIFSYAVIKSEAILQNKSFDDHLSHLLVHSLLHLLGYDHELETDAEEMEDVEIKILQELAIKSPYNL